MKKHTTKKATSKTVNSKSTAKAVAAPAVTVEKKISRTARMFQLVLAGMSNEKAVEKIKAEYGKDVPTNTSSIAWCRTQLHSKTDYAKKHNPKGLKVLTDAEAKKHA